MLNRPNNGASPHTAAGARLARRAAWLVAAVGAVLLVAAVVTACAQRPAPTVGASSAAALASAAPSPSGGGVPTFAGTPPSAGVVVPPARLRIAKLGVNPTINPVGVDERTGDFAVPPSVDVVGWYKYGPGLEAKAGSIVIAGHVDSAEQGRGAFYRLRELGPGDRIEVTGADGKVYRFDVVAREIYLKTAIPLHRYFARDGAVRLTLITCGGPFDSSTGHYRDNVVVTAQPVAG
jgi:hypothetical protein